MGYLKSVNRATTLVFLSLLILSCGESITSLNEVKSTEPWKVIIESGNFGINTAAVTLFDDARSLTSTNYFAYTSSLPTSNFEYFDINVFIPMNEDINIYLNDIDAYVRFTDSQKSDDIYLSGEHIQRGIVLFDDEQEYSQFRLTSRYTGTKVLNRDNFANYHMTFQVQFVDKNTDKVLHQIDSFYNEVYKRES